MSVQKSHEHFSCISASVITVFGLADSYFKYIILVIIVMLQVTFVYVVFIDWVNLFLN